LGGEEGEIKISRLRVDLVFKTGVEFEASLLMWSATEVAGG
jgi:hypothetical protein